MAGHIIATERYSGFRRRNIDSILMDQVDEFTGITIMKIYVALEYSQIV